MAYFSLYFWEFPLYTQKWWPPRKNALKLLICLALTFLCIKAAICLWWDPSVNFGAFWETLTYESNSSNSQITIKNICYWNNLVLTCKSTRKGYNKGSFLNQSNEVQESKQMSLQVNKGYYNHKRVFATSIMCKRFCCCCHFLPQSVNFIISTVGSL